MLRDFLVQNQQEILAMTEKKTVELAGIRPSSEQLKQGLPIFYRQLLTVLEISEKRTASDIKGKIENSARMAKAASENDEPKLAEASEHPEEEVLAKEAGIHGTELLRLGYTLSHVVHAYGAMCQSITELATEKHAPITPNDFHDLNRCLDIAIAGAVTEFQAHQDTQESSREVEHLGFLAHELRNALSSVNLSLQMIRRGTVGFEGSTGKVMDRGLKRIEALIDRSLTEVRLHVDPKIHPQSGRLLQLVDQIVVTASEEARNRKQTLDIKIDPALTIETDLQLFYSAVSNLIQNALKYTHSGGKIQVRGNQVGDQIVVEVEDECGGLPPNTEDLFKPFEQQNKNRKGLGLGLTIAKRAVELNHGTIDVTNLPKKGCIFKITLTAKISASEPRVQESE